MGCIGVQFGGKFHCNQRLSAIRACCSKNFPQNCTPTLVVTEVHDFSALITFHGIHYFLSHL